MKHIKLFILVMICNLHIHAQQNYFVSTTDSLKVFLFRASSDGDYKKMSEINIELNSRKNEIGKILELDSAMKQYVNNGNYAEAAKVKDQKKILESSFEKKEQLRDLINTLVRNQDYESASRYKDELLQLRTDKSNTLDNRDKNNPAFFIPQNTPIVKESTTPNNSVQTVAPPSTTSTKEDDFDGILYYNYVSGIPLGIKYFNDGMVYTVGYGNNEYASAILRTDIGHRGAGGFYAEIGLLTYNVNSTIDANDTDLHFIIDWEFGYAEKFGGIGLLVGLHVVEFNSAQISLGIGF